MYKRNRYVEETYAAKLSELTDASGVIISKVNDSFMSGTDDYSLVNVIGNLVYTMANDGLLYNLNRLDHVDPHKTVVDKGLDRRLLDERSSLLCRIGSYDMRR